MRRFDVVVIGAGPAGLCAAAELRDRECLLLDRGPLAAARDRASAEDLLSGVGGAGLFSDGKHSFFPSATALWKLPDRDALCASFDATAALLRTHGVEPSVHEAGPACAERWQPKRYPSVYMPFAERLACIDELWSACPDRWSGATVIDAERDGEIRLHVDLASGRHQIQTRDLVIATGRWSPLWTRPWLERLGVRFAFQRDEIGVRIETASDHPLFAALPGVDGKLVLRDGDVEIRTFCTCRDGEVVLGQGGGLRAYSGRADCPPTGRSNVGLVVRGKLGDAVARAARAQPTRMPLAELGGLGEIFGELGARAVTRAIEQLREWAPALNDATVYAPAIEGVGEYPVDDNLQLAPHVWVAGDACGRFRGIVASMISGRYVAHRIRSTRA